MYFRICATTTLVVVSTFASSTYCSAQPEALKQAEEDSKSEVQTLIRHLYSTDSETRCRAAIELGGLQHKAKAAVPQLIALLGDTTYAQLSYTRTTASAKMIATEHGFYNTTPDKEARKALILIGAPAVGPLVAAILEDCKRPPKRGPLGRPVGLRLCGSVLWRITDPDAATDLLDALKVPNDSVNTAASSALRHYSDATTKAALAKGLSDQNAWIRLGCIRAYCSRDDPKAAQSLIGMLNDPDADFRRAVLSASGRYSKDPQVARAIIARLADKDAKVHDTAAQLLVGIDCDEVLPDLIALTHDKDPLVRRSAARSLRHFAHQSAEKALVDRLSDADIEVRRTAVRSLCKSRCDDAFRDLLLLINHKDHKIRNEVRRALTGWRHHEDLEQAIHDSNPRIRKAARTLLRDSSDKKQRSRLSLAPYRRKIKVKKDKRNGDRVKTKK